MTFIRTLGAGARIPTFRQGSQRYARPSGSPGGGTVITPPTGGQTYWQQQVVGATQVMNLYPDLWADGAISKANFFSNSPFDSGHFKITDQRYWNDYVPEMGRRFIRVHDPKIENGQNVDPWHRRVHPAIDWGAKNLVTEANVGFMPRYGFSEFAWYAKPHQFVGSGIEGWSPGQTNKHIDGWSHGGVGATGQNPQSADGVFEGVLNSYGIAIYQNGDKVKGDVGYWEAIPGASPDGNGHYWTTPDYDGSAGAAYGHGPLDYNNETHRLNKWVWGYGLYAHDPRIVNSSLGIGFKYETLIHPLYPNTNRRIHFEVGNYYQHRCFWKLNTPGQQDGEFYWEININETGWFTARHITTLDMMGNYNPATEGLLDNGFTLFSGGGYGDSFGHHSNYYPSALGYYNKNGQGFGGASYYCDRNYYIEYKRNWVKAA